jgi:hypothetical protein
MRISISNLAPLIAPLVALALHACVGDSPDPIERRCTKALYDRCATEHDCMSNECFNFPGIGLTCTMGCSASNPCPDLGEERVPCDASGLCKPAATVECTVVP